MQFLKTERLVLRYITQDDFEELKSILQDKDVMYAWEYTFTDNDVQGWIDKNLQRYAKSGLGYFILEKRSTGEIIGQAALMPDIIHNREYYEILYIKEIFLAPRICNRGGQGSYRLRHSSTKPK